MSKPTRFQAEIGDRTLELSLGDGEVTVDGRTRTFTVERMAAGHLSLLIDGRSYTAVVLEETGGVCRVQVEGRDVDVRIKNERDLLLERFGLAGADGEGRLEIRAPMPGLVLSIAVADGNEVNAGDGVLVLEAMKMENELRADRGGVVKAVHVAPGDAVKKNDLLVEIE